MTIATLIAANRLDERLIEAALTRLPGARFDRWVEEGSAVDLQLASLDGARDALAGWEGVDIIPLPYGRDIRLFVADMDSTMIGQECIDELADYAGVKPQVAAITERAMRGELDFVGALTERVALLEGLPEVTLRQCLDERVRPNPGAKVLIRTLRRKGVATLLVSGGFTAFAAPVADRLGFAEVDANVLEIVGGKLTGRVTGRIVDSAHKRKALEAARIGADLTPAQTAGIGDGANDLPMVEAAGLGIAYRAKPALAAAADALLNHHPLNALLWALGLPSAEWVRD